MLSREENETLTQVGPGTPMGDLLRRYWHPVAAAEELEERPARPVRLLGEDLVLFKTGEGTYALLERWCAHRLTDLAQGYVEDGAIRCPRHGWLYSDAGQCLDQPMEEEPFCEDIKLDAYLAEAKAGMVWAYLGPRPAPLIPDYEPFTREDGLVQVVFSLLPCNWLQCHENSMDGIEVEQLMEAMEAAASRGERLQPPPFDFGFEEFEHGFVVQPRGAPGPPSKTSIWPNGLFAGDGQSCRFEWRVPMDDTTTLNVAWFFDRQAPGRDAGLEKRVVHWYAPVREEEGGEAIRSHRLNKKFAIWLNQAPIVDRTKEVLAESDAGVVMLRNKLFSQIALIADGGEPKALVRDPEQNRALPLPFTSDPVPLPPRDGAETEFPYLAGQPEDVRELYRKVRQTWAEARD